MIPEFASLKVTKAEVKEAREVDSKSGVFTIRAHLLCGFYSANGEVGVCNVELPKGATKENTVKSFDKGDIVSLVDAYSIINDGGVWAIRSAILEKVKKQ